MPLAGRLLYPQVYPDLERGESARETGRRHIPTRIFKQAVHLTEQAKRIEATLAGIGPFNATKKQEEALFLLTDFFPQMEDFEGELKKYSLTIARMEQENAALTKKAWTVGDDKMKAQIERDKLSREVRELRHVVSTIPEDLRQQLRGQAQTIRRKERY